MAWLGFALIVTGVVAFAIAIDNTNWVAPQAADPGNKFIWPSIGIVVLGVLLILAKLAILIFDWTH